MGKYKDGNYIQLPRKVFNDYSYEELPIYSRWIYTVMCELEHKYTGKKEDFFFRSDEDLANDCGLSLATIKRYKKPLIELELIQHWNMHFRDTETGKLSEKKVSAYRIL
jgi:hypothetical protein